jgi:6-phosphogluconolactonase (cycloisomerase 2 family)
MRVLPLKYALVQATAIALLTSCADGPSTPSTTTASQPNQSRTIKHLTSSCPCLYVADEGSASVTVYAEGATGNATPIQTISDSYTGLTKPTDVAVDASRDIYVANSTGNGSVTVYSAGATGNVAPIQTIVGSMTVSAGVKLTHPAG